MGLVGYIGKMPFTSIYYFNIGSFCFFIIVSLNLIKLNDFMEYFIYYLIFTVGTVFGACSIGIVNYMKCKNEKD